MNTTKTDRTNKTAKRLTLTRETLRTLSNNELRLVAGGAGTSNSNMWTCYRDAARPC